MGSTQETPGRLTLFSRGFNPIEERLTEVFEGKYRVKGAGNNFLTKILAVHDPMNFTVDNRPILKALKYFDYNVARGYTAAQQYLEFARLMKRFRVASGAKNLFYVDAFFFDFWERHIKNSNDAPGSQS